MSSELVAAMGPLPRTHGMLGAMLESSGAYRTDDIHHDPRFRGWWPREHPDMRSFLGVPIRARDEVIGAFYLTEKVGTGSFDELDQELIELLAAHAAIAITNARLYERSRELSILSERNRLALELHDVVSQKLFSLNLSADSAATLWQRDPPGARAQLDRVRELARESLAELRSLILGLRPADLAHDGLEGALRKEVEMLGRVHAVEVELRADCTGRPTGTRTVTASVRLKCCGSPRRRFTTPFVMPRPGGDSPSGRPRTEAVARGHRRRSRLRSGRSRAALPASRTHLDGGAGARARGDAGAELGAG